MKALRKPVTASSALPSPRKLVLRHFLSPGDLLMLTAAVRDLHRCHPGKFLTDVRSPCPDLWRHNPYLTPLDEKSPDVTVIQCQYPLIHRSNQSSHHFIHGFIDFLSQELKVPLRSTAFQGDIHLSPAERRWPAFLPPDVSRGRPLWIVNAGGKYDYTIKWWSWRRYQQVIDHFGDRVTFVQVGEGGHYHPPLRGVVDLRRRTTLRQLIHLCHHAHGVLCGVTFLMHLAAAVPTTVRRGKLPRSAVIVAGGREPPQWEAYPHHRFLHTVGLLPCCATGGCWKSRTVPLGDGEPHDSHVCVDVRDRLPACMDMIGADEVIRQIERCLTAAGC